MFQTKKGWTFEWYQSESDQKLRNIDFGQKVGSTLCYDYEGETNIPVKKANNQLNSCCSSF